MDWEVLSEIIVALLHFFDGIKVQSRRRQLLAGVEIFASFVRQLNLPLSYAIVDLLGQQENERPMFSGSRPDVYQYMIFSLSTDYVATTKVFISSEMHRLYSIQRCQCQSSMVQCLQLIDKNLL